MNGLSSEEVNSRREKGQYNGNHTIKTKSIGQIFYTNIFTLFNMVNVFLAFLLCMVGSYKNMMFMGVVFWNLLIGIVQEVRSKIIIDRLTLLQEPVTKVVRDGREQEISVEDIVLDDIIMLKNGKQVAADSVVLSGKCQVNESLLTGESEPVQKCEGDKLLSGSYVISGNVVARVENVGKDNYVNKITENAKYVKKLNSEMMTSIKKIIKGVTIILIPMGVLLFANQLKVLDGNLKDAVVATVAAVIGMIPSGLVLLTSMVLAVSVIKLARKDTLVKELYSIEGLARVNVLCIDKTGTLTEGKMQVEDIISLCDKDAEGVKTLLKKYISVLGDENATSEAIAEYFDMKEFDDKGAMDVIPFSSDRKYSAATLKNTGTLVLGAYEYIVFNKNEAELRRIEECAKKGLRVLTFAWSTRPIFDGKLPEDVQPLGLVLLSDRIREDAEDTLKYFKEQGVLVKVISGDNPVAVSYIAKKVGIEDAGAYVDATTLDTDEKLRVAARKYNVFGRVTPEQKLKIIKILKEDNVVAMIGDGVNDVMALKESDCSIAMEAGADAARNVSQIVLMKSNFVALPAVVAEGRQTVNNICRSAVLYLNKTLYSSLFALIFMFLPIAYPIRPVQLTLIGALTIGIPSFILAMEKNNDRLEGRFMNKMLTNALPAGMMVVTSIAIVITLGYITGTEKIYVEAICAYVLAIGSFVNLINVCRPLNKFRMVIIAILFAMFAGIVRLAGSFFELNLLNIKLWIFVIVFATFECVKFSVYKKLVKTALK